jgi:hypothetical protein
LAFEPTSPRETSSSSKRFGDARNAAGIGKGLFQFRDLRTKAAIETDEASGTRSAQALHGTRTAAVRVLQVNKGYLSRFERCEKDNPSHGLLRAMGLRRVVLYEQKDTKRARERGVG